MSLKVSNSKKKALFTEINITPLTDIFLVLLIIMMVVAPTFQQNDSSINIPEINSGINVEEKKATVSITKDGLFYINGEPIEVENISTKLIEIKPTLSKSEVLVKADAQAKSRDIMQVMRSAKEAEYEKLTVAGEPLSKKEQNQLKDESEIQQEESADQGISEVVPDRPEVIPVTEKRVKETSKSSEVRPYAEKPRREKSDFAKTDWEE